MTQPEIKTVQTTEAKRGEQSAIKSGYKPQADDTSIESDVLFFQLLRQRIASATLTDGQCHELDARRLSLCSLQRRFVSLSPQQFADKVAIAWLKENCPPNFILEGTNKVAME